MIADERREQIITFLQKKGRASVEQLSKMLLVTSQTIRRDLDILQQKKHIEKVHGGAVLNAKKKINVRKVENLEKKQIIAKLAAQFVDENDTLMIDASTTTLCLVEQIQHINGLIVITSSIDVLNLLSTSNIKVITLGGEVDYDLHAFFGTQAVKALESLFATHTFTSCQGIDIEHGIMNISYKDAVIKEQFMQNSHKRYLLFDDSKLMKTGPVKIKGIETIDYFITNQCPPPEWLNFFNDLSGELIYPK